MLNRRVALPQPRGELHLWMLHVIWLDESANEPDHDRVPKAVVTRGHGLSSTDESEGRFSVVGLGLTANCRLIDGTKAGVAFFGRNRRLPKTDRYQAYWDCEHPERVFAESIHRHSFTLLVAALKTLPTRVIASQPYELGRTEDWHTNSLDARSRKKRFTTSLSQKSY